MESFGIQGLPAIGEAPAASPALLPVYDDASFLAICLPDVRSLYEYWDSRRNGRRLPGRGDIDPIEMRNWLGRLLLYEIVRGDDGTVDFRYRLVGTRLVHVFGKDHTGKLVSEGSYMRDPTLSLENMRAVVANRRPRYRTDRLPGFANKARMLERLFLPLAADGETVDMLLVFIPRIEVLTRQVV